MKSLSFLLVQILLFTSSAHAKVHKMEPVSMNEVKKWNDDFSTRMNALQNTSAYPQTGYTECRAIKEIEGTHLCISNTQRGMNRGLVRASCFIEGFACGYKKGTIISLQDQGYEYAMDNVGGHDLRAADLSRYWSELQSKCEISGRNPSICPHPTELNLFENFILPEAKADPNFVVITFGRTSRNWMRIVSHEIYHALYFNQPGYAEAVRSFWTSDMTEDERKSIRNKLAKQYDQTDEELMINEFQAYILEPNADVSYLSEFVAAYRSRLAAKLNESGIIPLIVQ